jgi:hypothetical protein
MAVDSATQSALREILGRLEQGWQTLDFALIRSLWDTARAPVYQAEEAPGPCLDWPALDRYWSSTSRLIRRMGMRITSEPRFVEIAPGLVTAFYEMHWDCEIATETHAVGGDNRVYATFRRTLEGWRFAQYVESPLAPIMYVRRLYEQSVTPGFATTGPAAPDGATSDSSAPGAARS